MKKMLISLIIFMLICLVFAEDISLLRKSLIMATLWQSTSAEYRALTYQAYNIAKLRLDEELKIKRIQKRAIIVDADETVLDNTAFEIRTIVDNAQYYGDFDGWVENAEAEAIPGALEFLNYAHEKGCDIYYISNRKLSFMRGTQKNLESLGFPQAVESHILLKDDTSDKGIRREKVAEDLISVNFPEFWEDSSDREDAREIIEENEPNQFFDNPPTLMTVKVGAKPPV